MSSLRVVGVSSLLVFTACTLDNPAFGNGDEAGGTSGATETSDGTTTDEPTTDEPTTDEPTTEDPTTDDPGDGDGDPTTGEESGSEETGDGDGDEPLECEEDQMVCGDMCVEHLIDPENCGSCDNPCNSDAYCEDGECTKERIVFVTSTTYTGDLGGVVGADQRCQDRADAVELEGEFRAWISDGQVNPMDTFTKIGYFVRTDGLIIADSWEDLTDGELVAPISIDENMVVAEHAIGLGCEDEPGRAVWTAVNSSGGTLLGNCDGWMDDQPGNTLGKVGYLDKKDELWTRAPVMCSITCAASLPLYCFQQ